MKSARQMSDPALSRLRGTLRTDADNYARIGLAHTTAAEVVRRRLREVEAELARRAIYAQREH